MQEITVRDAAELQKILKNVSKNHLFRGQTRHYLDQQGRISMPTSFSRRGCEPPLQFKWTYYASFILQALFGIDSSDWSMQKEQALLQHYGWRSFFIDATASPSIGAWFAGHKFEDQPILNLGQDCHGKPLVTAHQVADYRPWQKSGHLYVISKGELEARQIETFDLSMIPAEPYRLRIHTQFAWLIGPMTGRLPPESVVHHISGPARAFQDFAAMNGHDRTDTLFPDRTVDPIIDLFYSIPWEKIPIDGPLNGYTRGLRLPEYDDATVQRHPRSTAFYEKFWVSQNRGTNDSPLTSALFLCASETLFHAKPAATGEPVPEIVSLVEKHGTVVLESEQLIRHPPFADESTYMKGIIVSQTAGGLIEIGELVVDHPGTLREGFGNNQGRFYEVDESRRLAPRNHPNACPCNNEIRHRHHLWTLSHFDDMLSKKWFFKTNDLEYVFKPAGA